MSGTEGGLWVCAWCLRDYLMFLPSHPHTCPVGHEHRLCVGCVKDVGAEPPDLPGQKLPLCPDSDEFLAARAVMGES